MTDFSLIGFGVILTVGSSALVLSWFGESSDQADSPSERDLEITELQQQCQRLREELKSQRISTCLRF